MTKTHALSCQKCRNAVMEEKNILMLQGMPKPKVIDKDLPNLILGSLLVAMPEWLCCINETQKYPVYSQNGLFLVAAKKS